MSGTMVTAAVAENADTSASTPSPRRAPPRKTLGRYEVTGRLGAGSMGVVFAAVDPSLDRRVAVKLLHEGKSADPEGQQRMLREGQALARLSHPNIVQVFDVGHVGETVFVAMELVEGSTLREWLGAPRSRNWRDVVRVFSAAGRGLAAAHAAGVVHRDFKPDNVLVGTDNRVRVMDFGLALAGPTPPVSSKSTNGGEEPFHATRLTHAGTVFGTPAYMAPEQFAGRAVTELSDQFSFCVALYEALFGRRPFDGDTFKALASAAMTGEVPPAPRNTSVPASIRKALFRGLAVAPEQRWPSMLPLLVALKRRRRTRVGVVVVGGMAALVGAELMVSSSTDPCDEAGAAFRQVWNDGTRRQTRLVLARTELAYAQDVGARVSIRMDAFAQQWAKTRRDVCLANDEDQPGQLACLDALTKQAETTLRVLLATDLTTDSDLATYALEATAALRRPSECVGPSAVAMASAHAAAGTQTAVLVAVLDECTALRHMHQMTQASARLNEHQEAFEALGTHPLQARALLTRGQILIGQGNDAMALEMLAQAHDMALATQRPRIAATAAVNLTAFTASAGRLDEAHAWSFKARLASRASEDPVLMAAALRADGNVSETEGDALAAREKFDKALTMLQSAPSATASPIGATWVALGGVSRQLHEFKRAESEYGHALKVYQAEYGEHHPRLVLVYEGLSASAHAQREVTRARAFVDLALAIEPDGRHVPMLLAQRGYIEIQAGQFNAAVEAFSAAAEAYQRRGAAPTQHAAALTGLASAQQHLGLLTRARQTLLGALALEHQRDQRTRTGEAVVLHNLAELESELGLNAQARVRYTTATHLWEAAYGQDSAILSYSLTGLGELALSEDKPGEARQLLERSLSLCAMELGNREELGETKFALARALWADPNATADDRRRATTLAGEAAAAFEEVGAVESERKTKALRWAATHNAGR